MAQSEGCNGFGVFSIKTVDSADATFCLGVAPAVAWAAAAHVPALPCTLQVPPLGGLNELSETPLKKGENRLDSAWSISAKVCQQSPGRQGVDAAGFRNPLRRPFNPEQSRA